jgi:hypothetical protein
MNNSGIKSLLLICLLLTIGCASKEKKIDPNSVDFSFIASGDYPYGKWQSEQFQKGFVPAVENEKADFIIHVGDIKGGSSLCTDKLFDKVYNDLDQFSMPLFFTPGDNDWTDCHRPRTRAKKPISAEDKKFTYSKERLAKLRNVFYKDPRVSMAGKSGVKIVTKSQPKEFQEFPLMVENQMWNYKDFLFASLHIVGSNNNSPYQGRGGDRGEFQQRDKANIKWLQYAFEQAKMKNSRALVLYYHAEVGFSPDPKKRYGFKNFIKELEKLAPTYSGQVLLIHGDSHAMAIDRPLLIPGDRHQNPIPNVMRLEVPGGYQQMAYVKVEVLKRGEDFLRFRPVFLPMPKSDK